MYQLLLSFDFLRFWTIRFLLLNEAGQNIALGPFLGIVSLIKTTPGRFLTYRPTYRVLSSEISNDAGLLEKVLEAT